MALNTRIKKIKNKKSSNKTKMYVIVQIVFQIRTATTIMVYKNKDVTS